MKINRKIILDATLRGSYNEHGGQGGLKLRIRREKNLFPDSGK